MFPFSNVIVWKRLNASTNTNITFYGISFFLSLCLFYVHNNKIIRSPAFTKFSKIPLAHTYTLHIQTKYIHHIQNKIHTYKIIHTLHIQSKYIHYIHTYKILYVRTKYIQCMCFWNPRTCPSHYVCVPWANFGIRRRCYIYLSFFLSQF